MAPKTKPKVVARLIYENVDGLNNKITKNDKLDKAKDSTDEFQADSMVYCEHRMGIGRKSN
jgi:hypothetical protein